MSRVCAPGATRRACFRPCPPISSIERRNRDIGRRMADVVSDVAHAPADGAWRVETVAPLLVAAGGNVRNKANRTGETP